MRSFLIPTTSATLPSVEPSMSVVAPLFVHCLRPLRPPHPLPSSDPFSFSSAASSSPSASVRSVLLTHPPPSSARFFPGFLLLPQLRHRADANAQAGPGSEAVDHMVAVEQLFDRSYLRRPVSPAQWAALIAYAPLGVILALLRVILTVLLCAYAVTTKAVVPAITPTDKT